MKQLEAVDSSGPAVRPSCSASSRRILRRRRRRRGAATSSPSRGRIPREELVQMAGKVEAAEEGRSDAAAPGARRITRSSTSWLAPASASWTACATSSPGARTATSPAAAAGSTGRCGRRHGSAGAQQTQEGSLASLRPVARSPPPACGAEALHSTGAHRPPSPTWPGPRFHSGASATTARPGRVASTCRVAAAPSNDEIARPPRPHLND